MSSSRWCRRYCYGKISEEFWERKVGDWGAEEQQVQIELQDLDQAHAGDRALDAQKVFELANKACLLYLSQDVTEKAKLLRMVFELLRRRRKCHAYIHIPVRPYC